MSERNVCISLAASIRDVCRKNPDRGVDLILSVSVCISIMLLFKFFFLGRGAALCCYAHCFEVLNLSSELTGLH